MVHHKLGGMFGAGEEGHYPLLQGCLTAPDQPAKPGEHNTHSTPTWAGSLYTMYAAHSCTRWPGFTEHLSFAGYSAQNFPSSPWLEVSLSTPLYSFVIFIIIAIN